MTSIIEGKFDTLGSLNWERVLEKRCKSQVLKLLLTLEKFAIKTIFTYLTKKMTTHLP